MGLTARLPRLQRHRVCLLDRSPRDYRNVNLQILRRRKLRSGRRGHAARHCVSVSCTRLADAF